MKELSDKVKQLDEQVRGIDEALKKIVLTIPNIPNKLVPVGKDDTENYELRRWGEPTKFDFEPKAHWDIGENLDILDAARAAKVTGSRFYIL